MMLTTFGSPSLERWPRARRRTATTPAGKKRLFVDEDDQIARPIEIEAHCIALELRVDVVSQRPDVAGFHVPLADERGNRDMNLAGHAETGVVIQLNWLNVG